MALTSPYQNDLYSGHVCPSGTYVGKAALLWPVPCLEHFRAYQPPFDSGRVFMAALMTGILSFLALDELYFSEISRLFQNNCFATCRDQPRPDISSRVPTIGIRPALGVLCVCRYLETDQSYNMAQSLHHAGLKHPPRYPWPKQHRDRSGSHPGTSPSLVRCRLA